MLFAERYKRVKKRKEKQKVAQKKNRFLAILFFHFSFLALFTLYFCFPSSCRREEDGSHFEAILLSEKHLPTNAAERTRIEQMGGFVFKGRVFGQLAVSRAFGLERPTKKEIRGREEIRERREDRKGKENQKRKKEMNEMK